MRLVSVDCGVRGCGVAVFDEGILSRATYIRNPMRHGQGATSAFPMASAVRAWTGVPSVLAIETMQWYEAGDQKGNQNDLGGVQLVAGAIIGILAAPTVMSYVPRDWKGTIDGDVCTERILDRLTIAEKACIISVGELDHNTVDGIGIGLKYLGRFEPRRVYARE